MSRLNTGLDSVHHAQDRICGSVIVLGAKLMQGKEVELCGVE